VGEFQVLETNEGSVRLSSYSQYDPIDVPTELFSILHRFDGRNTRAIIASIRKKDGISLDDDFVRQLVDFGILVQGSGLSVRAGALE
jgi:hypothetical protein